MGNVIQISELQPLQVGLIVSKTYKGTYVMRTGDTVNFDIINLSEPGVILHWRHNIELRVMLVDTHDLHFTINDKHQLQLQPIDSQLMLAKDNKKKERQRIDEILSRLDFYVFGIKLILTEENIDSHLFTELLTFYQQRINNLLQNL